MLKLKCKSIFVLGMSVLFLFVACNSTKSEFGLFEESSSTLNPDTNKKKLSEKKKFVLFQFGNDGEFITVDESSVFTPNFFGTLKQKKTVVSIDPKLKEGGFGSIYLAAYYFLFWDFNSRKKVFEAVDNYFSDFQNKRLKRDLKTSYKVYGKIPVRLRWGTTKISTPNNGTTEMYVGYMFKNNSPYFTLTIYPTFNKYSEISDAVDKESLKLTYYFTKSQLSELKNMLSEEIINNVIFDFYEENNTEVEAVVDVYDEYEEAVVEDSADNQSEEVIEIDE